MRSLSIVAISILFSASSLWAAPVVQILSPENAAYAQTQIPLRVVSNEPVDFYLQGPKRNVLLASNTTEFESSIYGKKGTHELTILASNENGSVTKSVVYTIVPQSNPISITSCGILVSSDTEYRVDIDLNNQPGWTCLYANLWNAVLDLNGFTVGGIASQLCSFSQIVNGTVTNTFNVDVGDSCLFTNLHMEVPYGIWLMDVDNYVFEDVHVTGCFGFMGWKGAAVTIRNSTVTRPPNPGQWFDIAFWHYMSTLDKVTLDNVAINDFPVHVRYDPWSYGPLTAEYTLRDTPLDTSRSDGAFDHSRLWALLGFLEQHLVVINLTDQDGNPIAGSVEIADNTYDPANVPPIEGPNSNPTRHLIVGTDESGRAEVYLTASRRVMKQHYDSPVATEDFRFDPYTITARSRGVIQQTTLDFSQINSTVHVPIQLNFAADSLPPVKGRHLLRS